jgi:hypothetical protein
VSVSCWLRPVMIDVGVAVNAALEQVTLADMTRRAVLSRRSRDAQAPMYEI